MVKGDWGSVRREYLKEKMDESKLPENPMELFVRWLEEARGSGLTDPTAMTLSTVGPDGMPSSRIVLLKKIEAGKLLFFTSLKSRKAKEIKTNAGVALHFYWPGLERQVKIAGSASLVEKTESDRYFHSRPYESKISAWVSPQSEVIPSREYLDQAHRKLLQKYKKEDVIPRPEDWGGYAISPMRMEFWQGGLHRLHDRFEYLLKEKQWSRVRLAP